MDNTVSNELSIITILQNLRLRLFENDLEQRPEAKNSKISLLLI